MKQRLRKICMIAMAVLVLLAAAKVVLIAYDQYQTYTYRKELNSFPKYKTSSERISI